MFVTMLFDVEDIITTEADDITARVADLVWDRGTRATFCVVGERARQWSDRGRFDVIRSLARHDIGFHTSLHSVHPTILEGLVDKGWEDGVSSVLASEGPGVNRISSAFGRHPSCFGGPGNTWGPQVNEAMRQLGVPAVVYAHSRVPRGDVHRYCGAVCYPVGRSLGDDALHVTEVWKANLKRLIGEAETRRDRGDQWMELFMGHPSRMLHDEFWDGPNFSFGKNPPAAQWKSPRQKSRADVELVLKHLGESIDAILSLPGIQHRTIGEMNELFTGAREEELTPEEAAQASAQLAQNIDSMAHWVILPPDLDLRNVRAVAEAKVATLRRLVLR